MKSIADGKLSVENAPQPFSIAKDVKIKIDGKDAKLDDLKLGERVSYEVESKTKTVIKIEQSTKK